MTDDDSSGRLWDNFDPGSRSDGTQRVPADSDRDGSSPRPDEGLDVERQAGRSGAESPSYDGIADGFRDGPGPSDTGELPPSSATDRTGTTSGPTTDRLPSYGSDSTTSGTDDIETVLERVDAFGRMSTSSQVLILGPEEHSVTEKIYRQLLTPKQSPEQNVLLVVAYDSRTTFPPAFADVVTTDAGKQAVVEVGGQGLENLVVDRSPVELVDSYEYVSSPKNLAKIGIMITKILDECDRVNPSTVMAVHTLTAISRYTSGETLFQFLHTLRSQLESTDVMGLYHLNPLEVDSQIADMMRTLFDVVVEVTPDGEIDVQ